MNGHLPHPHLLGLAHHSTDRLLLLAQQGDALAFEALYRRMCPVMAAFLHTRPWIRQAVEDIVQEAFCRVWERRSNSVTASASAKTYLLAVALNVAREYRRDTARMGRLRYSRGNSIATAGDAASGVVFADLDRSLQIARSRLSENQKAAVSLVYDEQLDLPDAANRLGCSPQALRRRLQEARRKLYDLLTQKA